MEKTNLYSLRLKFKRHNLTYKIINENNEIQLDGTKIKTIDWIINIIFPFAIALLLLITLIFNLIPSLQPYLFLITLIPLSYGTFNLIMFNKKKKNNKDIKIIKKDGVRILSGKSDKYFGKDSISNLQVKINENGNEKSAEGLLNMITNDGNIYILLSIWDKNITFLKKDLEYFKEHFTSIIN